MTPRQIIQEIFRDYSHNLEAGMTSKQSLDLLKAMLIDQIEYERDRGFKLGVKSGRLGAMTDSLFSHRHSKPAQHQSTKIPVPEDVAPGEQDNQE